MSVTSQAAAAAATAARAARPVERLACATGAALIASGLFHLGVFFVDGGPWDGPVSWRKPFTFGVSFGLTLIAVAWVTSYVRMAGRTRAALLALFSADCVLEVAGITVQAWRGVPSHFDMETPADTAVAMSLAVGGAILVGVLGTFAVAAFRSEPGGPAGMPAALRAGFALLAVGLLSGAVMIARGVVDTRTGHQQAAYHSTGMLKPLHGVTLHAVLVLPALAWAVSRTGWTAARQRRAVLAGAWLYAAAAAGALGWGVLTA
ncbi:hypothetical protein [Streptomyces sp. NPDC049040]|uniref:hypothetical protein n=1 Tax=Streptomyces sp. NPDC049040 TaxID=3365593 RepID=UPI00371E3AD1